MSIYRQAADSMTNTVAGTTLGLTVMGVPLETWASILACIWFIVQIVFKIVDHINKKE